MSNDVSIQLRLATISDLSILQLWDEQEHVIASDPNDDWNWEVELQKKPDWRAMYIAEKDKLPIGFVQIIDATKEETHYWGDVPEGTKAIDIWIGDTVHLGKGYGTTMMKIALNKCFEDCKTDVVLIDPLISNNDAIRFYKRLGFTLVGARTFGEDECIVYEMTRKNWEVAV